MNDMCLFVRVLRLSLDQNTFRWRMITARHRSAVCACPRCAGASRSVLKSFRRCYWTCWGNFEEKTRATSAQNAIEFDSAGHRHLRGVNSCALEVWIRLVQSLFGLRDMYLSFVAVAVNRLKFLCGMAKVPTAAVQVATLVEGTDWSLPKRYAARRSQKQDQAAMNTRMGVMLRR